MQYLTMQRYISKHLSHFEWKHGTEEDEVNVVDCVTAAAKCPHSEKKEWCDYFTGNTVQDCGLCRGNTHKETAIFLALNGLVYLK